MGTMDQFLGGNFRAQNIAVAIDQGDGGVVAGGLNAEDQFALSGHDNISLIRSAGIDPALSMTAGSFRQLINVDGVPERMPLSTTISGEPCSCFRISSTPSGVAAPCEVALVTTSGPVVRNTPRRKSSFGMRMATSSRSLSQSGRFPRRSRRQS